MHGAVTAHTRICDHRHTATHKGFLIDKQDFTSNVLLLGWSLR